MFAGNYKGTRLLIMQTWAQRRFQLTAKNTCTRLFWGRRQGTRLSQSVTAFAIFMVWPQQLFDCNLLYSTRSCRQTPEQKLTKAAPVFRCNNHLSWYAKSTDGWFNWKLNVLFKQGRCSKAVGPCSLQALPSSRIFEKYKRVVVTFTFYVPNPASSLSCFLSIFKLVLIKRQSLQAIYAILHGPTGAEKCIIELFSLHFNPEGLHVEFIIKYFTSNCCLAGYSLENCSGLT